jgi:hypothetical protein
MQNSSADGAFSGIEWWETAQTRITKKYVAYKRRF